MITLFGLQDGEVDVTVWGDVAFNRTLERMRDSLIAHEDTQVGAGRM